MKTTERIRIHCFGNKVAIWCEGMARTLYLPTAVARTVGHEFALYADRIDAGEWPETRIVVGDKSEAESDCAECHRCGDLFITDGSDINCEKCRQ